VRRRAAAAAFVLSLAACAERPPTVVDGSSAEAFERTVAEARRDLSEADRLTFDRAINTVGSRRLAARDTDALARVTFDGMTAAEIVADQKSRDQ
jgi:hypothetical protein